MGTRILLADDSITIQKVVNLTFADEGIEVIAVSNGDTAERRLDEVKPDLVLADIFMPGKNGYELCEAIKQNSQFRNVPVVLLVGAFEPFDQAEARRVRADAHLTKPFESRTLVETVRRLIKTSGRTTGPIASMPEPDDRRDELRNESDTSLASPLQTSSAARLDLSAMIDDRAAVQTSAAAINTGELASRARVTGPEGFEFGGIESPSRETVTATVADTHERFDAIEDSFSPISADLQEVTVDFDRSEGLEPVATGSTISFEREPSAVLDVDVGGYGEKAEWRDRDVLETTKLEPPPASIAWQETSASSFDHRTAGVNPGSESAYASSGSSSETVGSTLLAVDEPLGDVLLDEADSSKPLLSGSLDVEIADLEVGETPSAAARQFDLIDTIGNPSSRAFSEFQEKRDTSAADKIPETPKRYRGDSFAKTSPLESEPGSHAASEDMNWTSPRAGVYSTAQLDSVVMPVGAAEYLAENSFDRPAQPEETEQVGFASSTMWTEEEARFTPIDIEAVSVEEPEPKAPAGEPETGIAFSRKTLERPDGVESQSVGDASGSAREAAAQHSARASDGAAPVSELSPSALEEIVRRVIAEMSDSVVREVAWEVVPDCVERVIDQLTRESLSRQA
jgi:CheY-like chemotaxis protein